MKNIDKMKQNIISQIKNMSIEKFERLMDVLTAEEDMIDISGLFGCKKCRKIYNCSESDIDAEECSRKFRKYAMSEEK